SGLFRTTLNSVKMHFSSHPRFWTFIAFLWIQALIISIARTPPPCFPDRSAAVPVQVGSSEEAFEPNVTEIRAVAVNYSEECPSGRIFVYELPPSLNRDLVKPNCTDLAPWDWECGIISNHGYGRAASELRGFLPGDLYRSWYHTNQYTLEVIFHHRILRHGCRTMDPDSATAFYIPFYAGLAVGKSLWSNDTAARDRHCKVMLRLLRKHESWSKSNGSDHFTTIGRITWDFRRLTDPGRSWGSSFLNMPQMQKVTRFIVEKYPGDDMDVSVPYPIGFHPRTKQDLEEWQSFVRRYNRSSLAAFTADDHRNWAAADFRHVVRSYCMKEEGSSCRAVDCSETQCLTNSWATLEALLSSEFCLQPKRDSFTSKWVFECMVAGSVPVFFSKTGYEQYEWFFPGEPESYSVLIDQEGVRNGSLSIKGILMGYGGEEMGRKREKLIESIPRIIYAKPNGRNKMFKDGFDVALDGVLERIKEEKEYADFL
ncbi:hypothetical protein M569_01980, partial [Genlisea aurea]